MEAEQVSELLKSGRYDGAPIKGKLIETHISWVILTRNLAFKIKKPIKYPFLDFSTLEKRKFYCERELYLNRRLTNIYLDVISIRYKDGFFLGEIEGQIIDYAVRMKRLQAPKKMDEMIRSNRIKASHINKLAQKISDFHKTANVKTRPFDLGQSKQIFNDILDVTDWTSEHMDSRYTSRIKEAVSFSNSFLEQFKHHIQRRIQNGFKRDGHGDLHAKNIFLYKDPIIFDCIEFNDSYRQIDVLNEVAFFCMDLEAFGRWDLSEIFMEKYVALFPCMNSSKDEQLFVYYKFYRANVRAKVNVLRAMQASEEDSEEYAKEAMKYLDLMEKYKIDLNHSP
ncbi:hypothetical protein [Reichenbachiella sp. MALMAid0571]|uniref:hypothetical protein n=1 Tax=Reichenbachiella sp. MALMAid0571 TaxID=3143939 RepID=UPI0032DF63A8